MQVKHSYRIDTHVKRSPLIIAGVYLIFSFIWIVYSDSWVLRFYDDPQAITTIQTYKGWAFVLLSSVVIYFLILSSNKTILKLFKNKLRVENIFEATFEQAAVGIMHHDEKYNWMRFNDKLCDMLQYTKSELKKLSLENLVHPDDVEYGKEFDQKVLRGELPSYQIEKRYRRKDESIIHVLLSKTIAKDTANEYMFFVSVLEDITYQKENQQKLRNLNETLKKYTKELQVSSAELEQFAYVASHDLQEPLRMIASFMELLKVKYGDVLDEKALQYIHYAADGAKRMKQIILDLLDFSRVGKNEDQLESVDLNELVDFVLQLNQKLIKEQEAFIEVNNLPILKIYRSPIIQIFQNLIENSLKYSREGVRPKILIQAEEKDEEWIFSVQDNGKGIDPEYFDKIFIIFQRLELEDKYGGTGLGLSVVKKIVDNLNGRIWVGSEVNKGSTFYFSIPK